MTKSRGGRFSLKVQRIVTLAFCVLYKYSYLLTMFFSLRANIGNTFPQLVFVVPIPVCSMHL